MRIIMHSKGKTYAQHAMKAKWNMKGPLREFLTSAEMIVTCRLRNSKAFKYDLTLWSPKFIKIIFNSAKKTQHTSITQTYWLMLFKEIIAVYSENHM
jgi:hypothetical protein